MPTEDTNGFSSLADFRTRFWDLFSGPTFYSTFTGLDGKLRKKVMITVSIANNCAE